MIEKKLLAYRIDSSLLGIDIKSWDNNQLGGNHPFISIDVSSSIPDNYGDISSIENWNTYGTSIENDYLSVKNQIKILADRIGWTNLSSPEKDLAIKYYAYTNIMDPLIYLMTIKGYPQASAQFYILQEWHKHHRNLLESCKERWYYVKFVVAMYLNFADAEELLDTTQSLIFSYTECGRLGINYGDKNPGIMDYLESTNLFENQGLKENGYTLNLGTWDSFIGSMKDIMVYGKYNKY